MEAPGTVKRGLSESGGGYGKRREEAGGLEPVGVGDRVCAWVVTAMVVLLVLGGVVVMVGAVWEVEMLRMCGGL